MRQILCACCVIFLGIVPDVVGAEPAIDFGRQVRPILSRNCFACHGPDESHREGGLRLDLRDAALAKLDSGKTAIVPGEPDHSELIQRITSTDPEMRMPPPKSGHELTAADVDLLRRWIAAGAGYSQHWSFVKPSRLASFERGARDPIDGFIRRELAARELSPSPEADRAALLRRASLDLRGLPPHPDELDEFLADTTPDAYERLLDRLFADPAFGERWARMWLDLARYADSAGYGSDPLRLNMWRYRDWVIEAFNQNLPYDQFTVQQLAGDLLPNATPEQRMATAFHRNTMTNSEGGTDDEEFRTYAVWDRVDTTFQVWMGITMGCAKCHSHKYDPITQHDYYRVFAIWNQTADRDLPDESPVMQAPDETYQRKSAAIDAQIASVKQQFETDTPEFLAELAAWENEMTSAGGWTVIVPSHFSTTNGTELQPQADHSLLALGPKPDQETYVVQFPVPESGLAALRLEAIPDASLPNGGSGRGDNGSFVLSQISAAIKPAGDSPPSPRGRFVRIERSGSGQFIHLAEVEVFSDGKNIARSGKASQSSTDYDGEASRGNDGNTNGDFYAGKSVTHTAAQDNPWWEVDLLQPTFIERIVVWNRTDNDTGRRMTDLKVSILNDDRQPIWRFDLTEPPQPSRELPTAGDQSVKFRAAYADDSQAEFPIGVLLETARKPNTGWSVGAKSTELHQAAFVLMEPVQPKTSAVVTIQLTHESAKTPPLGRFRISAADNAAAAQRIGLPQDVLQIIDSPPAARTGDQARQLKAYYRKISPALKGLRDQMAALEKSRPAIPTLPVLQELPTDQHRRTNILLRGNFLSKGVEVEAGFPSAFHAAKPSAKANRLELAEWIASPENPLTARVAANRFWAQLFGAGLVTTEEDFGAQGELPSHPDLLDWLAVEFSDRHWDVKQFLRLIVSSAPYRQTAKVSADAVAKDPPNRWLSRGPRFRLEAEQVRDQALAVSGLLSHKIGGPSVYPYQPSGMWQAAFNGQRSWTESAGEDKFRRGLYTFWRRTVPYPSMAAFDAPSREICAIRRIRTNTPLQAFVTMNDPVYVEISQAFARRIHADGGTTPETRAAFALKLILSRVPDAEQVAEVVKLYHSEWEHYRTHPEEAIELSTKPLGELPAGLDAAEAAAWTVVANMLLNLDGVLMRG